MTTIDKDGAILASLLAEDKYLVALDLLLPLLYGEQVPPERRAQAGALRDQVLAALRRFALSATHPPRTTMKFGTSGWRGLLGEDFTLLNVMRVTQGLVDVLLGPQAPLAALGVADAAEVRRRGCVLAHDTRLLGPEFAAGAARVLLAHGVPVVYLGTATTPEVSAALAETGAAFSINLTPSHNPYTYHGYKFNPRDGGPATAELTAPIAGRANEIFEHGLPVQSVSEAELAAAGPGQYRREDPVALYRQALKRRLPWLDLERIVAGINRVGMDLYIDNAFGAAIGKYERLLEGVAPGRLHVLNGEPDPLFGGRSREPSPESFRELQGHMAAATGTSGGPVVGIINDGDSDRFVGGGRATVLPMNRFGPLVVRYLTERHGLRGDVTRSLMTSHMADAAQRRYQPQGALHETRVGFQYLKPYIEGSVNSWEESDGMSPMGWSRDKDGLCAALILVAMVLDYERTPEELDRELDAELGQFLFERRKITGKLSGEALVRAIGARFGALAGAVAVPGVGTLQVARVDQRDGVKLVFGGAQGSGAPPLGDGWWVGIRASGTEPAARVYVETGAPAGAGAAEVQAARAAQSALHDWAAAELQQAMG